MSLECQPCALNMHEECFNPTDKEGGIADCCCWSQEVQEGTPQAAALTIIGGYKGNEDVKDPTSTGRKRAGQLKPIIPGMTCEWAGLLYAGGGVIPIIGCDGVELTPEKGNNEHTGNIHHGPDKSTLNNTDENLHRVCGKCHNRWHTLNDPLYAKERPAQGAPYLPIGYDCIPHDKHTVATPDQVHKSEAWWATPQDKREGSFRG